MVTKTDLELRDGRTLHVYDTSAELWLRPGAGHISVLNSAEAALDWLWEHT